MLNNMNDFEDEIKNSFIFHIPHSSLNIPDITNINLDLLNQDLIFSTDLMIDTIFDVIGVDKHICDFSRLFCDVERFNDETEFMNKFGRGVFYTKTHEGKVFRNYDKKLENSIIENYYKSYHKSLSNKIQDKINQYGVARIIDCHSYNKNRLYFEQETERPEICLGVDEKYTPKYLLDFIKLGFERNGLEVKINTPYSGSYYPLNINGKFETIMIEINKKLYMDDDYKINMKHVYDLKSIINNIFTFE